MSLNDPQWGRKGSEDDTSQKENQIKEPPKETDEEPRKAEPSKNETPGRFAQNNNDGDLEELWKQFNDRLNSMLGNKGAQNRNAQKEEPSASPQTQNQKDEDYDFDEPPLRKDHEFKSQQNSFGSGGSGNGGSGRNQFPQFKVPSSFSGGMAISAIVIALGAWLASGFYIVPEGQNGVVTTFGRYTESTNAGFRWHLPYPIQDVSLVDVSSVRKAEIGLRGGTQRLKAHAHRR